MVEKENKDPAVLWYFDNWFGGTCTLSRHLKGCYMDLLFAQFNNGHLSLDEIKTVLGSDFGSSWPTLQKKFKKDDNGLYYNRRLLFEVERRKKFSEKQSDRRKTKTKSPPDQNQSSTNKEHGIGNETGIGSKDLKGVQGGIVLKPEEILSRIIENEYKTREFVMKHFGFSAEEFNAVALYFVDKNRDTEDFKQAYPEVLKYFRNWTQRHLDFLRKEVCKREPELKSKQTSKTNVSDFKNDYSEAETKVK